MTTDFTDHFTVRSHLPTSTYSMPSTRVSVCPSTQPFPVWAVKPARARTPATCPSVRLPTIWSSCETLPLRWATSSAEWCRTCRRTVVKRFWTSFTDSPTCGQSSWMRFPALCSRRPMTRSRAVRMVLWPRAEPPSSTKSTDTFSRCPTAWPALPTTLSMAFATALPLLLPPYK